MAPPTPPNERDDVEVQSGSRWQDNSLQRHIAEAHKQLEVRLVAAIELQHASLLRALAGVARPEPRRYRSEGGDLGAATRTAGFMKHVAPIQNSVQERLVVAGREEMVDASLSGTSCDDSLGVEGASTLLQLEEYTAGMGASGTPSASRLCPAEEDGDEEDEEGPTMKANLSRSMSARLETAAKDLNNTKNRVVSGRNTMQLDMAMTSSRIQHMRMLAERLKDRREFELFIMVSITVNAISLGASADFSIKHPREEIPQPFRILDYCFMGVFVAELLLRLVAEGRRFFHPWSRMFKWNMFDAVLVCATVLNESAFGMNLSMVRVFRILRLVNMIRTIKLMAGFRELRMMVSGIMNCGRTLLWSIFLLTVVAYIYAVFCLQLSAEWLASNDVDGAIHGIRSISTVAFLDSHFPSLDYGIYTLFKAISGGISWGEIADPLEDVSVLLLISFPFYIMFTVFCVLNIITAAFVDAAARTRQDEDTNALEYIEERQEWIAQIKKLFHKHDADHDSNLDWDEFKTVMADWRTQQYFVDMGLVFDFQRTQNLFKLFDWDGNGTIDVDEFAHGVHHLRGNARSLDMFREFQSLNRRLDRSARRYEKALARLSIENARRSCSRGESSVHWTGTASFQPYENDEPSGRTRSKHSADGHAAPLPR